MKKTIFAVLCFFCLFTVFSQDEFASCRKIESVQQRIKELHYAPVELNADQRKEVIALYFNILDDGNYFLTTEELARVRQTAFEHGLCDAYKLSLEIYTHALDRYDSITADFFSKTVVLKKGELFVYNPAEDDHLRADNKSFAKQLQLNLKYDYLGAIYAKLEADSTLAKKITPELDKAVREKLAQKEKNYIQRKLRDKTALEKKLLEDFLNAVALRFDPHSGYFSLEQKADLEEELSGERMVFGIQYEENENFELVITGIMPGSAAWNSNEIQEGDVLVDVTDYKGKKHELSDKGAEFLSGILGNPAGNEATFTVRHKNGGISAVKLIRTKVENTENSFTGYLLSDDKHKIGYIALPSFYTDYEDDAQLGCANDVAKEILLLKKDSIQGLVLDLRNNGGGSLKEAIELSGLFIDEGPMSVYQRKDEKPSLLKDMNRGTVYNGPLIVMVNNRSASASEFFAGCMQDYKRALVVGDTTYGKGTAQGVYPLSYELNNEDFVKVTGAKFYHVSGRSNQEKGIAPDVLLEDIYSRLHYYLESEEKYHLENDSTAKKVLYKPYTGFQYDRQSEAGKKRMAESPELAELKRQAEILGKRMQDDISIPLDFDGFGAYSKSARIFWDEIYAKEKAEHPDMKVNNHSLTQKFMGFSEYEKKFHEDLKKELQSDVILHETFLIFKDLLTFEQNK
ncbi:MAG: carboxyl-terminal protease [Crocinitomicaceae bacterium]|jgi:carboxyl-terminal processing protease|nr:carboxyl-terminal protease [Crocinitomicaceae bacterium]